MARGRPDETAELTVPEAPSASEPSAAAPSPSPSRNLGRYLVIEEIGAGGMGLVLRAYDPKLGREVAVKRLRIGDPDGSTGSARMMREAQAMAKLSHPNVVPVYDVDVDEGTLFIAMEYVQGDTLRDWLRGAERSWRSVVDVFVDAGRGLAAAHAQGIVHRDFKPANVLVGDDGRVRVMDFGLARAVDGAPASEPALDTREPDGASVSGARTGSRRTVDLGHSLTEHGTVMGTPSYMAPEQHAGLATDPRTDQYAFATALWEALYGRTPFRADGLAALAEAKRGPLPRQPSGTKVPSSVHAVLARGLSVDPADRFPGMDALLLDLVRAAARRRPWLAAVPVAMAAVGIAAFAMAERAEPCVSGEAEIEAVWGEGARDGVREGLLGTTAAYAGSTWERVATRLDAYAAEWAAMHRDACEATHVRREQSGEALDLRMSCLSERKVAMQSAVDLLSGGAPDATRQAVEIVSALAPVSRCSDLAALRDRAPSADQAEAVQAVRTDLERAGLQERAGAVDDALATAQAAREAAHALDHPPLHAEADARLGALLSVHDRDDEALPLLESALQVALRHRHTHAAAVAAVELARVATGERGRPAEAQWLAKVALGLAEGDGTDVPLVASAMLLVGAALVDQEKREEAEPYYRVAVERVEQALGSEHPDLVGPLLSWTSFLSGSKKYDESEVVGRRALQLAEAAFGPDHPQTGEALQQLGWLMIILRRPDEAKALYDRALAIAEGAFGPDHPEVWSIMGRRAAALAEQELYDDAAASLQEAIQRMDARLPKDHRARASALHNLARVHGLSGDHARAVDLFRQASDMRRRLDVKSDLAAGMGAMAEELYALGRLDEAEIAFRETMQIVRELRPDGPHSGMALVWLGRIERARGNLEAALPHLEAAWALERDGPPDLVKVDAAFDLGQALWDEGKERARGRRLVEMAREALSHDTGEQAPPIAAAIDAWLAAHPL